MLVSQEKVPDALKELLDRLSIAVSKTAGDEKQRYPFAFGYLEAAIKKMFATCTDVTAEEIDKRIGRAKKSADPDDLKDIQLIPHRYD